MNHMIKKFTRSQRLLLFLPLLILGPEMTGCGALLTDYHQDTAYDIYNCSGYKTGTGGITSVTLDGWNIWDHLKFSPEGRIHLPWVGPLCTWGTAESWCPSYLPFNVRRAEGRVILDVNYERGPIGARQRFEGEINLKATSLVPPVVTHLNLDPTVESWVTKTYNGECRGEIVFTKLCGVEATSTFPFPCP